MPASRPNSPTQISSGGGTIDPSQGAPESIELTDLSTSAPMQQGKQRSRPRRFRNGQSARRESSPKLRAIRYEDDEPTTPSAPSTSQAVAGAAEGRLLTRDGQYPKDPNHMTDATAADQGMYLQSDLSTRTAVRMSIGAEKTLGCITCGRRGRRSQRTEDRTDALASELGSAAVGQTVDQGTTACCSLC